MQDARVLIEFDAAGNLRTRLPASWPAETRIPCKLIEFRNASLEVRQTGRRTAVVQDVRGRVIKDDEELRVESLKARFLDRTWTAEAVLQPPSLEVAGRVRCESLVLDSRVLATLPLVPQPPNGIQVQAATQLDCEFHVFPDRDPEFRLALKPRSCDLQSAAVSLSTPTTGQIVLTPNELRLESLSGKMAGATGTVTGRVTRGAGGTWQGQVTGGIDGCELRQIDLQRLLPEWPAVASVEGQLSGRYQLELDGDWHGQGAQLELRGTANGSVEEGSIGVLRATVRALNRTPPTRITLGQTNSSEAC